MTITETAPLSTEAVADLAARFRGQLIGPADPGYDEARRTWNGLIDKRPGLIARCLGNTDIVAALAFAREHELPLAVRGGGHSVAGYGVCDDGVVIDLALMRGVHVDPVARTARVQGGATLADVDHETQYFGLATPTGNVSSTGVAGLTLSGGLSHLRRKFGMSVDNLVSADVVTAEGRVVTASANENPELFWGIRGGGGNFGVVSSLEFRLHELGPLVTQAMVLYPFEMAREV
ncbi:MAG TPA: FAD-binding protein, partial [Trueperaceae bacterium]|nr:FAD-binding protein [Trueperaceae bacterium]